jgi:uncharacterized membrane protein
MAQKRLVLAIFDAEAAADEAAAALDNSNAFSNDAVAIMVLDDEGKLKAHKVGTTSGGKGAAAGIALALLGPVGIGVGAAGGALLGKLHHKGLGMDDADRDRLTTALGDGKAAVGVVAELDDLVAVESILVSLGGTTESHEFDDAVLRETADSAGG